MASVLRPFWDSKRFSDVLLVIEAVEVEALHEAGELRGVVALEGELKGRRFDVLPFLLALLFGAVGLLVDEDHLEEEGGCTLVLGRLRLAASGSTAEFFGPFWAVTAHRSGLIAAKKSREQCQKSSIASLLQRGCKTSRARLHTNTQAVGIPSDAATAKRRPASASR